MAEHHALALNRVTASLCAERQRATFIRLSASSQTVDRHRTAADYSRWAELLAARTSAPLDVERLEIDDTDEILSRHFEWAESDRQHAVDELGILDNPPGARLDHIVALAQRLFGTRCAAFSVSDGDRQWHVACVGLQPKEVPRISSFSTVAIRGRGPLVVPDAFAEERFCDNPLVQGDPHIRFYACFPVESPSGERIGVLCVFDPNPRRASDVGTVLLRELALMVQFELWRSSPR